MWSENFELGSHLVDFVGCKYVTAYESANQGQ